MTALQPRFLKKKKKRKTDPNKFAVHEMIFIDMQN